MGVTFVNREGIRIGRVSRVRPRSKAPSAEALRIEFITKNLRSDVPYTLRQLADEHGISYGHARNMSSDGNWLDELTALQAKQRAESTQAVREVEVVNEMEIRTRQAQFARLAMNKAILKLQSLDPAALTVRESIELLKLGLQEERRALGLIESVTYAVPPVPGATTAQEAMTKALAIINRLPALVVPVEVADVPAGG